MSGSAAHVVLGSRVVRKLDAGAGERVENQARAVEADGARALVDAAARPGRVATAPGVRHTDLRLRAFDDVLDRLVAVDQRYAAVVGDAGVGGLEDAQPLQELLPSCWVTWKEFCATPGMALMIWTGVPGQECTREPPAG